MSVRLRTYRKGDLPALYHVSVMTGHGGGDARHLYRDPDLIGHVYVGPYANLLPELCIVAEDEEGVAGYVVGAVDTRAFEVRQEAEWWPELRKRYPDPGRDVDPGWDADTKRAHRIHHPAGVIPDAVVAGHPGHLHMNLLPRLQRRGIGTRLLEAWYSRARAAGASSVHVGVNPGNAGGLAFWQRAGFRPIALPPEQETGRAVWLGRELD
ncbi:GNAT family N-acetyltransferase [Nisaea acidiphila]|uniref:GNAT family N-acetyltransferase n=1 Tax=Nisaea acidiphila TaxID=1862145 RepID=A0A9J7AVT5_9PROT|nr:GNAT family N-acetyltransferase [Nisaea acidiphila]UUX51891.1 GNAT family N-acetyltransferase [Nisaea acidiphila]